jgi:hypothetical protein
MSRSRKSDMYRQDGKKWIDNAIKKPGALHKSLGVPMGKKIPEGKLNAALHSKSPLLRERANLAKTLRSFGH